MLLLSVLAPIVLFSCTHFRTKRFMSWDDYIRSPREHPYVLELETHYDHHLTHEILEQKYDASID